MQSDWASWTPVDFAIKICGDVGQSVTTRAFLISALGLIGEGRGLRALHRLRQHLVPGDFPSRLANLLLLI